MSIKRNAIILAAGTSSRFVPLCYERPKGLLEVKGEILIERQIRQLQEAGIEDICIVVGYKAEQFEYLRQKYGVELVMNEDFDRYNNTSSIIRVLDKLGNTYICSSDNFFPENVFSDDPEKSFYSSLYARGSTGEYCLSLDDNDNIKSVTVGGSDSWYMVGHVYFSEEFSKKFKPLMKSEYEKTETRQGYWEDVYIRNIDQLPAMQIHKYRDGEIFEFDSLDELRLFDESYVNDTRSGILKAIVSNMNCKESDLSSFKKAVNSSKSNLSFTFLKDGEQYLYSGKDKCVIKV